MIVFYINTQPKYVNIPQIHQYGCRYLQKFETEEKLGKFYTLKDALAFANKTFKVIEKCDTCCSMLRE